MRDLVETSEKILFLILLVISLTVWSALIFYSKGVVLLGFLIGYIFFIFIQSRFISYLRGNGAIVTEELYPDLCQMLSESCDSLGMKKKPTMVLIQMNGLLNAFATRFLGKHYVVLLSDIVDALEDEPDSIKFYIGHELGHIKRNHLFWQPVLAMTSWLPLIGAGYSRAREYTCDNHGRACCDSDKSAVKAMTILSVGVKRWKTMNLQAFLKQKEITKGFWMSFHEIISDYPWLVKRIARLHDDKMESSLPMRNPFAWVLAIFIPRLNAASLIMMYILILIIGGVAKGQSLIKEAQKNAAKQAPAQTELQMDYLRR